MKDFIEGFELLIKATYCMLAIFILADMKEPLIDLLKALAEALRRGAC